MEYKIILIHYLVIHFQIKKKLLLCSCTRIVISRNMLWFIGSSACTTVSNHFFLDRVLNRVTVFSFEVYTHFTHTYNLCKMNNVSNDCFLFYFLFWKLTEYELCTGKFSFEVSCYTFNHVHNLCEKKDCISFGPKYRAIFFFCFCFGN